jgi:hypothetical protein
MILSNRMIAAIAASALSIHCAAQTPCKAPTSASNLRQEMEPAVFKVSGVIGGKPVPFGTATLIHPSGYFLTASHIFDDNGTVLEAYPKGYPAGGKLVLKNSKGVEFNATLFKLRSRTTDPDLALIRADLKDVWTLGYPDMSLGWVPSPDGKWYPIWSTEDLAMLGYKLSEALPDYVDFRPSQYRTDKEYILLAVVTSGMAFNGTSGSVAVTRSGLSQGTLRGSSSDSAASVTGSTYVFTPTAYLAKTVWLSQLPPSPGVAAMLAKLRTGALGNLDRQKLFEDSWKQLELLQIVSEILKNPSSFKGLDADVIAFLTLQCYCRGMLGLGAQLIKDVPAPLLNAAVRVDSARVAFGYSKDLKKLNAPEKLQQATLASALASFESYSHATQITGTNRFASFAFYDYALAQKEAADRFPALNVSMASVKTTAARATELDANNANAWDLRATIARREGDYATAASHTERAVAANPPNKLRLMREMELDRRTGRDFDSKAVVKPRLGDVEGMGRAAKPSAPTMGR